MLDSLPARPLTQDEVDALSTDSELDRCRPIAWRTGTETGDHVVGIELAISNTTRLIGYDTQHWQCIVTVDDENSEAAPNPRFRDWMLDHYAPTELTLEEALSSRVQRFVDAFPPSPVEPDNLTELEQRLDGGSLYPVVLQQDLYGVVGIVGMDSNKQLHPTPALYGFGYTGNEWTVICRLQSDNPNPVIDRVQDWCADNDHIISHCVYPRARDQSSTHQRQRSDAAFPIERATKLPHTRYTN